MGADLPGKRGVMLSVYIIGLVLTYVKLEYEDRDSGVRKTHPKYVEAFICVCVICAVFWPLYWIVLVLYKTSLLH